jgi:hypothetical protein
MIARGAARFKWPVSPLRQRAGLGIHLRLHGDEAAVGWMPAEERAESGFQRCNAGTT